MLQISLVIFRELLEILLLLGLVIASTANKIKNANIYIAIGTILGILCSIALALTAPLISEAFSGQGQEICNSVIVFTTAILLGATVLWMQNHSSKIKSEVNHAAITIEKNFKQKLSFIFLIGMMIFREGSEIVLFIYSKAFALQASLLSYFVAITAGATAAVLCSILFYKGIVKVGQIFKFTSVLLILVTSGLVAEAFGILVRSGSVSILSQEAWDLSNIIPNESLLGQLLNILINYNARPSILEVAAFTSTFTIIYIISKIIKRNANNSLKTT